jgi:hypothetical protein
MNAIQESFGVVSSALPVPPAIVLVVHHLHVMNCFAMKMNLQNMGTVWTSPVDALQPIMKVMRTMKCGNALIAMRITT